jgi:hypothetical protein
MADGTDPTLIKIRSGESQRALGRRAIALGGFSRNDDYLQERCRLVDANRFTRRALFPRCTPDPTDSRTMRRLARRDRPKESIRDFLRSVEGQQKQAMREGTQ